MVMFFLILALVFVVLLVIITNIVIVPQSKVYVVERLGSYSDTWSAGLHIKIPFIERIAKKVSLKEQVADFPPQPVITRDNVTMQIDTVVFFQVMDAKLYTYGVNQPIAAIESLSATTLRNIIGEMELDHTLTSRDVINGKITAILDEATDKWGIKVNRVEVKNIIPPREIQEAMEKQMKAEREKRAVILKADGEKQAAITAAELPLRLRKGKGRVLFYSWCTLGPDGLFRGRKRGRYCEKPSSTEHLVAGAAGYCGGGSGAVCAFVAAVRCMVRKGRAVK